MTAADAHDRSPRVALVTGSARRVGRRLIEALARDGFQVIVHARDQAAAQAAANDIGPRAIGAIGADLRDVHAAARIARAVATITTDHGSRALDLLVNNAASFESVDDWASASVASWHSSFDVNVRAPYLLIQALLPLLEQSHDACVVNISDRAAHEHWTSHPLHAASKAALESLTLSGASALRQRGVRVNAIVPPTILAPDDWSEERRARELARGTTGSVENTARIVLQLADDRSRTGEIVVQAAQPIATSGDATLR